MPTTVSAVPRDQHLLGQAREILEGNWRGSSTVPAPGLYPHQWSWDSAFIAIGLSWLDQARAQAELESLALAQWSDGRIPHIVFNPTVRTGAYFPGPDFWCSRQAEASPAGIDTSGLIQPPLHAVAAVEVYRNASDKSEGLAFLARLFPVLDRWHRYLLRERDPEGIGVAAILHPWESGLDNSPAWEDALAGLKIGRGVAGSYVRRDLVNADPADRPSDAEYDRFVHLAQAYRNLGYDDGRICATSPFVIAGPLVNALLVSSSLALAEIARLLGEDPAPHVGRADGVRRAIETQLWDSDHRRYYSRNLRSGALLREASILSFMPLVDPELPARGVEAIVRDLLAASFHPPESGEHYLVPSYDLNGAHFDPRRYWRGPVWISTDWLIWRGLQQHGKRKLADHVADSMLALVSRSGFREYFDPFSGEGYGSDSFSWTAALIVDLLRRSGTGRA